MESMLTILGTELHKMFSVTTQYTHSFAGESRVLQKSKLKFYFGVSIILIPAVCFQPFMLSNVTTVVFTR